MRMIIQKTTTLRQRSDKSLSLSSTLDEEEQLEAKLVKESRRLIKILLVALSLDVPLKRTAFNSHTLSKLFNYLRFYFLLFMLVKFAIILALHEFDLCEYANTRYYLLFDWTVYYPAARRRGLIRGCLSFCAVQLVSKRSIFFNSDKTKKLDTFLFDYLSKTYSEQTFRAQLVESKFSCSPGALVPPPPSHSELFVQKQRQHQSLSFNSNLPNYLLSHNLSSENDQDFRENTVSPTRQLHDKMHWLKTTTTLHGVGRKSFLFSFLIHVTVTTSLLVRFVFLFSAQSACNHVVPYFVRYIGVCDLVILVTECTSFLFGVITLTSIIAKDLDGQMETIKREAYALLVEQRAVKESSNIRVDGGEWKLLHIQPIHLRRPFTWRSAHLEREKSYRVARDALTDFEVSRDAREVVAIQRKLILFLKRLDSYGPLVALMANPQYVWLATSLTFVPPLLMGLNRRRIITQDRKLEWSFMLRC